MIKKAAINSWRISHPLLNHDGLQTTSAGEAELKPQLANGCLPRKDGSTHAPNSSFNPTVSLTVAAGNRRCFQLDPWRLYLSPPSGLCSSPVMGRVGEKPKSKAWAMPKGTTHNPAPTCPGAGWRMAALGLHSSEGFVSTERCRDRQVLRV